MTGNCAVSSTNLPETIFNLACSRRSFLVRRWCHTLLLIFSHLSDRYFACFSGEMLLFNFILGSIFFLFSFVLKYGNV